MQQQELLSMWLLGDWIRDGMVALREIMHLQLALEMMMFMLNELLAIISFLWIILCVIVTIRNV